jgi:hypothetical protein
MLQNCKYSFKLRHTWTHIDSRTVKAYNVHLTGVFFFSMALPAHSRPRPPIQFRNHFSQAVGLLGRVISSSQGLYLNTGQGPRHSSSG